MESLPYAVSRRYSVVLLCYGVLSVLVSAALKWLVSDIDPLSHTHFLSDIHWILGVAALLVALLRWTKGVQSLPASTGFSIALAAGLPLGTLVFIYWLIRVRPKEREFQREPTPVRWYTAAIVLGALWCALSSVAIADLAGVLDDAAKLTSLIGKVYGGLAVALALVGGLRSLERRWGFYATFILNVVLVPLLPFGTAAAIVWFFGVRRYDKESVLDIAAEGAS